MEPEDSFFHKALRIAAPLSAIIVMTIIGFHGQELQRPATYNAPIPLPLTKEATTTSTNPHPSTPVSGSQTTPSSTKPVYETPVAEVTPAPITTTPLVVKTPTEDINTQTRAALVNILCTVDSAGPVHPISGSGVIIDARGIILTNAHIGQYFLLRDYPHTDNVTCVIRQGAPARTLYRAELLYIPTEWINVNRTSIRLAEPTGTGQYDFAFLRITGAVGDSVQIPSTFPYVPVDAGNLGLDVGKQIIIASYPAGFLGGASILLDLYPVSALGAVQKIFTFTADLPDLFSTGGTIAAQHGSSGGAVVGVDGELEGIAVTSTDASTTNERDLRALSTSHIERSLVQFTDGGFSAMLSGDLAQKASDFNTSVAPTLTNILVSELEK